MSESTLTLRTVKEEDLMALATLANNRDIWMNLRDVFPHPYSIGDAQAWFEHVQQSPHLFCLSIVVDNHPVGVISLEFKPDVYKKSAEIGYWLGEKAWGFGVATESVRQMVHFAFTEYDLARIEARVFGWNPASKRVLEKAGFKKEGTIRNGVFKDHRLTDEFIYGILKEEWAELKSNY